MRACVAILLSALALTAASEPPPAGAKRWIAASREHQPGTIDEPLLEVSGWQPRDFDALRRELGRALAETIPIEADRNDVLRRGVLLHTDIAILTPERAASFTRVPSEERRSLYERSRVAPPRTSSVIVGIDGQFLGSMEITAHWWFARRLAEMIRPDPAADPFVAAWYRATIAGFESTYGFGYATPHLEDALKLVPRDPWVLFYKGALHEAFAAPRAQNMLRSGPPGGAVGSPQSELGDAEHYFRRAVAADPGIVEARMRWGRVLGLLGRHTQAAGELRRTEESANTPRLRYLTALFLGHELGALGQRAEAQRAYARAGALYPTAQSPWIALSALARRAGDRADAQAALRHVASLPQAPERRDDPWWDYFRSYASNADLLMRALREPFRKEEGQ